MVVFINDFIQGTVWPKPQQQFEIGNQELEIANDFTILTDSLPKDPNCLTIRNAADRYWNWLFKENHEESLSRTTRGFIPKARGQAKNL